MRTLNFLAASTVSVLALSSFGVAGCSSAEVDDSENAGSAVSVPAPVKPFEPGAEKKKGFVLGNAAFLARFADASYLVKRDQELFIRAFSKTANMPIKRYKSFDSAKSDTQAMYLEFETSALLVFPGTDSKADAETDIDSIGRVDDPGIPLRGQTTAKPVKLHPGFAGVFRGFWSGEDLKTDGDTRAVIGIRDFLLSNHMGMEKRGDSWVRRDPTAKIKDLYIVGHSLGGALATLAVREAFRAGIQVTASYTFGAPRQGDDAYALELHKLAAERGTKVYRVVNYGDLVSVVPLNSMGYSHIHSETPAALCAGLPGNPMGDPQPAGEAPPCDPSEDDGNEHFVFLNDEGSWTADTRGQHTFFERSKSYAKAIVSLAPQAHLMGYYKCRLDMALGASTCPAPLEEPAKACAKIAGALADVMTGSTSKHGCGSDKGTDFWSKSFEATLGCRNVEANDGNKPEECLKVLNSTTCDSVQATLVEASCKSPFIYRGSPAR